MSSTMPGLAAVVQAEFRSRLIGFRCGFYACLTRRADALFEAVDAVLCADGPVDSFVELSLAKAFRRGHGGLYDALAQGRADVEALDDLIASVFDPGPGPVMVAVDVTAVPRPEAETCPERLFCHGGGRGAKARIVPGWPYSLAVGLEWGATSWTAPLDAHRLHLDEDPMDAAFTQLRAVWSRLGRKGKLAGRPPLLAVVDAVYDLARLAFLADNGDLPVQILGRVRSNRVFYAPTPEPVPGRGGRPARHGARFVLADPATHPAPDEHHTADNGRYGAVTVSAWHGWHAMLNRDGPWSMARHPGQLPIVAGTLILIEVAHLPGNRHPEPIWLWWHAPTGTHFDLPLLWMAYLRRFDIEHTIKFWKRILGWVAPRFCTPAQHDLWTMLLMAGYTQLRLARHLAEDLRRPWERPPADKALTPGRVRRGFHKLARRIGTPAGKPKPSTPGPGRPRGSTTGPRTRFPVNKKPPISEKRTKERSYSRATTTPATTTDPKRPPPA